MQKIRLIASDLDGTLLRNDKTLSEYTLSVLERCRDKGVLFFPATARPPRTLERWIPGLSYDGALCHNGAVAVLDGKIVWEQGISPAVAVPLIRRLSAEFPGLTLSAEIGGLLYANFPADSVWANIEYIPTDFSDYPDSPAEKLMVGLENLDQFAAVKSLLPAGLSAQISEDTLIMIQPEGVEKGRALQAICEKLGVSPDETVGFGDDWNDISLLKACGVGIAVENALTQVKEAADMICLSNQEDGPAHWLEQHILQ